MALKYWIIVLAVLLAAVASASAISCYECNANLNPGCADISQSQAYKDCSVLPGRDRCMKQRGPGSQVIRMCTSLTSPDGCTTNNQGVETCICSTNYCNSAPASVVVSFVIMTASGLLCVFL